jgi:hypothetical protein
MNQRAIIMLAALALCVLGVISLKKNPADHSDQSDPSGSIARSSVKNSTTHPNKATTSRDAPFWESAIVPDPGEHIPAPTIRPEDLGIVVPAVPIPPTETLTKAIAENDLPLIQSAALAWFQQDPASARDWLASQQDLENLQPAISSIANHIADHGEINAAMVWANIITEPTLRESTLFDIQALALRNNRITPEQIITDGLSPERVAELRSGAAGD